MSKFADPYYLVFFITRRYSLQSVWYSVSTYVLFLLMSFRGIVVCMYYVKPTYRAVRTYCTNCHVANFQIFICRRAVVRRASCLPLSPLSLFYEMCVSSLISLLILHPILPLDSSDDDYSSFLLSTLFLSLAS